MFDEPLLGGLVRRGQTLELRKRHDQPESKQAHPACGASHANRMRVEHCRHEPRIAYGLQWGHQNPPPLRTSSRT